MKPGKNKAITNRDQVEELDQQLKDTFKEIEKIKATITRLEKEVRDEYKEPAVLVKPAKQMGVLVRRIEKIKKAKETLAVQRQLDSEVKKLSEKIAVGKMRIQKVGYELNDLDRFIANPFSAPEKQRKQLYENAVVRRKQLKKELETLTKEVTSDEIRLKGKWKL